MNLSLARWDDEYGESAGYWLVRELPGFVLEFCLSDWHVTVPYLDAQQLDGTALEDSPTKVWGDDWSARVDLLDSLGRVAHQAFPTRFAALSALESSLSSSNPSSLCELLG